MPCEPLCCPFFRQETIKDEADSPSTKKTSRIPCSMKDIRIAAVITGDRWRETTRCVKAAFETCDLVSQDSQVTGRHPLQGSPDDSALNTCRVERDCVFRVQLDHNEGLPFETWLSGFVIV